MGKAARAPWGPERCPIFNVTECCIVVDLLVGEDNRTFSTSRGCLPAAQGSPGCVQEVATEAIGHLPTLPLYDRDGLCLSNTTHTVLATTLSYVGDLR